MNDVDWQALAAKYNTDPDSLTPEVRQRTDQAHAELHAKRARGEIAPACTVELQNFPIGLDDNYQPFPIRQTHATTADEQPNTSDE